MPQAAFPTQNFQNSDGSDVANGYLLIHLSNDAASSGGQIGARIKSEVFLGTLGEILDNPQFWENSSLAPNDTVYFLEVYNADGLRVCGPIPVTVGPSSSNLGFGQAFGVSFGS
jgi:hypothetical protein